MSKLYVTDQYQAKILAEWKRAFQQSASKVMPFATLKTDLKGSSVRQSILDSLDLSRRPDYDATGTTPATRNRFRDKTLVEATSQNVHMRPQRFEKFVGYEYDDNVGMIDLDVPVAETMENLRSAQAREQDRVAFGTEVCTDASSALYGKYIINKSSDYYKKGGIFGVTKQGLDIASASDVALPDVSTIAASFGGNSASTPTGLSIEKIQEALTILEERDVYVESDPEFGRLALFVTPRMLNELIASDNRLGDSCFGFNALKTGKVDSIANVRIIKTNMLPHFIDASGNITARAVMFNPRYFLFGLWGNPEFKITPEYPNKVNTYSVDMLSQMGSVRLDDKAFVTIDNLVGVADVDDTDDTDTDTDNTNQGS